jgi:hypothetical protein
VRRAKVSAEAESGALRAPRSDRPLLSVLVPVFNIEPYLRACVESVVCTRPPGLGMEVLLLDDASQDGSLALAQALVKEHGGAELALHVLSHPTNRGIAAVRNRLLDEARGQWLWFVDGDDLLAPGALSALHYLLHAQPPAMGADVLLCDYRVLRPRPHWKHRLRGEHHRPGFSGPARQLISEPGTVLQGVLATGNVFVWTFIARRELWPGLRFPEGRAFEDMATVPRLLRRARSGWHVPEPWVVYRRREGSITAVMSPQRVGDLSAALVGVLDSPMQPPLPAPARVAVAHQAARNLLAVQRHARRLPMAAEQRAALRQSRLDFLAAAAAELPRLWRHYAQRGWWWRALRLWWALRRGRLAGP